MTVVDRLEAALEALTPEAVAHMTPARRRMLSDALYANHALVETYVTGTPFPKVKPGVLSDLKDGRGRE
jgi:hypothetical protein